MSSRDKNLPYEILMLSHFGFKYCSVDWEDWEDRVDWRDRKDKEDRERGQVEPAEPGETGRIGKKRKDQEGIDLEGQTK